MSGKTVTHVAKPAASSITRQAQCSVFRREVDKQAGNPLQPPIWQPSLPGTGTTTLRSPANTGHNFANIPVFAPTSPPVQPKLTVGEPNDPYEQEADRIAETVMRMPEPTQQGRPDDNEEDEKQETLQSNPLAEKITPRIQRQASVDDEEEEALQSKPLIQRRELVEEEEDKNSPLQAKTAGSRAPPVSPEQEDYITGRRGPGQPLSDGARDFFEPRFGHDFSRIRIHADGRAAKAARDIKAQAFTVGHNIFFGANRYQPGTKSGRQLLAHELTHTVQQTGGWPQANVARSARSLSHPPSFWNMRVARLRPALAHSPPGFHHVVQGVSLIARKGQKASTPFSISKAAGTVVFRQNNDEADSNDTSVTKITDALDGITTASDSAIILAEFQGQRTSRMRAILDGLKAKAPEYGISAGGMIDWLFSDMTAEDSAALRQWLIRAGVHRDINRIIVDELYARLSGYTSDAESQEIYTLLVQYTGGGLDRLLRDLASRAGMGGDELGAWLLGDLERANAERVRVHFLALGAENAVDYAAAFTAAKIESLLSGYTGHSDSASILRIFKDTPTRHRQNVLDKLEIKTQARWGGSAENALMGDMDREDYEALRALGGVSLRKYHYTRKWYEKLISGAEWGMIVIEWISCGAMGIVTGVMGVIWDMVKILADVPIGISNLLWSLVYLMSGGTFGSENWFKVKQFFAGMREVLSNPSAAWDQYWGTVGLEFRTIEGPLIDCRRAEYFMRKLTKAVLNVAMIALAGYGIAKGVVSATKTAQGVARLRLLAGGSPWWEQCR